MEEPHSPAKLYTWQVREASALHSSPEEGAGSECAQLFCGEGGSRWGKP
jgi:hypothetical protein